MIRAAALRVLPLVPPPGTTIESTTIVVSGYPAVSAARYLRDGIILATLPLGSALPWGTPRSRVTTWAHRCGRCARHFAAADCGASGLGWSNLCARCATTLRARCVDRHGRLPRRGEFFCLRCSGLCRERERLPKRGNGRERCHWCRTCYLSAARIRMRRLRARRARA